MTSTYPLLDKLVNSKNGALTTALPNGRAHPPLPIKQNITATGAGALEGLQYTTLPTLSNASAFCANAEGQRGHFLVDSTPGSAVAQSFLGPSALLSAQEAVFQFTSFSNLAYVDEAVASKVPVDPKRSVTTADFSRGAVFLQLNLSPQVAPATYSKERYGLGALGLKCWGLRLTYRTPAATNTMRSAAQETEYSKPKFVRVHGLSRSVFDRSKQKQANGPAIAPLVVDRMYAYERVGRSPQTNSLEIQRYSELKDSQGRPLQNEVLNSDQVAQRLNTLTANPLYVLDRARRTIFVWGQWGVPVPASRVPENTPLFDAFGVWDLLTYKLADDGGDVDTSEPSNTVQELFWQPRSSVSRDPSRAAYAGVVFERTEPNPAQEAEWVADVFLEQRTLTPPFVAYIVDFGLDEQGGRSTAPFHVPCVELIETARFPLAKDARDIQVSVQDDLYHPLHGVVTYYDFYRGSEQFEWTDLGERSVVPPRPLEYYASGNLDDNDVTQGKKVVIVQEALPRAYSSLEIAGWNQAFADEEKSGLPDQARQGRPVFEVQPHATDPTLDAFFTWETVDTPRQRVERAAVFQQRSDTVKPLILVRAPNYCPMLAPATADAAYLKRLTPEQRAGLDGRLRPYGLRKVLYGQRAGETSNEYRRRLDAENKRIPPPTGDSEQEVQAWLDKLSQDTKAELEDPSKTVYAAWTDEEKKRTSTAGHLYNGTNPRTRLKQDDLVNHTGLAYDEQGYPTFIRFPDINSYLDRSLAPDDKRKRLGTTGAAPLALKSDSFARVVSVPNAPNQTAEDAEKFQKCLMKPRDTTNEDFKKAVDGLHSLLQPPCSSVISTSQALKRQVHDPAAPSLGETILRGFGALFSFGGSEIVKTVADAAKSTQYDDTYTPYVSGVNQTNCQQINDTVVRSTVNQNHAACNVNINRNEISAVQVASVNVNIKNINVSGNCCPADISVNSSVTQNLQVNQNIQLVSDTKMSATMTASNSTDLKQSAESLLELVKAANVNNIPKNSKGDPVSDNANDAVSGLQTQYATIPRPAPQNANLVFSGVTNNSNFLNFVEQSASVSAYQAATNTVNLDDYTCTAQRQKLVRNEVIAGKIVPQEVLLPCSTTDAKVTITANIDQTLNLSQYASVATTQDLAAKHDGENKGKITQENIQKTQLRLQLQMKYAAAAGFGFYTLLFGVLMFWAWVRARNYFRTKLIRAELYNKFPSLENSGSEWSFELRTDEQDPGKTLSYENVPAPKEQTQAHWKIVQAELRAQPENFSARTWRTFSGNSWSKSTNLQVTKGFTSWLLLGNGKLPFPRYLSSMTFSGLVVLGSVAVILIKHLLPDVFILNYVNDGLAILVAWIVAALLGLAFVIFVFSKIWELVPGVLVTILLPAIAMAAFIISTLSVSATLGDVTAYYITAGVAGAIVIALLIIYLVLKNRAKPSVVVQPGTSPQEEPDAREPPGNSVEEPVAQPQPETQA